MNQQHHAAMPIKTGADVTATLATLVAAIRGKPSDLQSRMYLFQLFCVEGQWEKAGAQLRALAQLSPEAQMLAAAYGQAIAGETMRAACFAGRAKASLLVDPTGWASDLVTAIEAEAQGDVARGVQLRSDAFDRCPQTGGSVDGRPFEALFDGDMRFGPTLEAIVAGRWGLIPFSAIEEIITAGPIDMRDLVWLPAEIRFREGPALAALLPVRYPGVEREADAELRLARRTEWRETSYAVHGAGQRMWTTDTGEDVGILSFRRIAFVRP
ncbi:type VI secretion system accessory protein TagJ [Sphingomonas sp. NFR15]|uniref:type VI secretion system accessory protein TagJ n=1 Tax=Sphingomonas sp. NFR15 TaxID=1566282 RepID=UPI000883E670|nr:type VI secretion system accessory protein TagJ [Sphingomonas sp. NFR15]SDA24780.1 type VI secretion system protein ImpE [Sphingomonas sp. NFR15]